MVNESLIEQTSIKVSSFFSPTLDQIKNKLKAIDRCYTSQIDAVGEPIQNAIDEIITCINNITLKGGECTLIINVEDKSIYIKDNGKGLGENSKEVINLLKEFSTNKLNDIKTVGENGIATIYSMFSTNYFKLVTGNGTTKTVITAIGLRNWKESNTERDINITCEESASNFIGTELTLGELDGNLPLFKLTYPQLTYLLRTKTFIGYTRAIWDKDDAIINNIIINFHYIDKNGNQYPANDKSPSLKFGYQKPYEDMNAINYLTDYNKELSDHEKREILNNKVIYFETTYKSVKDQRDIHLLACIVPNRDFWFKRSIELGLCSEEDLKDETFMDNFDYCLMGSAIVLSAKGMPTTIELKRPRNLGVAGYWDNLFILIEDPSLKFDIGRKSITQDLSKNYQNEYNRILKNLFNDFAKNVFPFIKNEEEFDIKDAFKKANERNDLGNLALPILKEPTDQEAEVNDLFIAFLATNIITGVKILKSGYRDKYDKLAIADNSKKIVIELKAKIDKILKDFNKSTKKIPDIDCIVCWDITAKDIQKFTDKNLTLKVNSMYKSDSSNRTDFKHSATHILTASFSKPIYVIDLKVLNTDSKNKNLSHNKRLLSK